MEQALFGLLGTIVGGIMTFWASYLLENKKLRNEQKKFTREKLISVAKISTGSAPTP